MQLKISMQDEITQDEVIALYTANEWSSAQKPDQLLPALRNSHTLVTARLDGRLVGIGNAISDGRLEKPPSRPPLVKLRRPERRRLHR